ncbi:MAG: S1 RNA-binding domain-containing protein [Cetobacterium sp.]
MSNFENNQEDFDFEALLNEYMPVQEEKPRAKVKGIIATKDRNFAYLDVAGQPTNVRVRSEELSDFNVGDEIEVLIIGENEDEEILIGSRRRVEMEEGLRKLEVAFQEKKIVKATIIRRINGGYILEVSHQQGFLPNSLSEIPASQGESSVGKGIEVMVKEIKEDKKGKKVLFSRKDISLANQEKEFAKLTLGEVVDATIVDVLDFGLTVKIGSVRGFIHISEIAWKKTTDLSKLFKKGEVIKAEIVELDPNKKNVKLSIKALTRNPWELAAEKFAVDTDVVGKVSKILPYGVFVEILDGVEGLVHTSDFTWNKKKININDFVKLGDEITVRITEFAPTERKLKLGIKQLSKNPWNTAAENYAVGKVVSGKVVEVKPFGIFVQIEEGVDGFIHTSDFSWSGDKKFAVGDIVEFEVIELNVEENKIKGSVKALTQSPWDLVVEKYKVGDVVEKEIKNIQDFGMFIKLEPGVDGFIPTQMASKDFIKNLRDRFQTGQNIKAEIVEIDNEKKRVKLSIKKVEFENEKYENEELIEKYGVSSSEN